LWNATTGEQVREFDQGSYWSDWSPDGTRLVFSEGVHAPALNVWEVASGEMLARLTTDYDGLGDYSVLAKDWSPDGNYIMGAGFRPGSASTLFIWDANTYELVSAFPTADGCALGWPEWSPDSTRIATGCLFVQADVKTAAHVWDAKTGEVLMELESMTAGWTYFTTWSPDGTQLITTHDGATIIIWDVATGEPVRTFTEHQGGTGAEWSPDGTLVASRGWLDRLIKVWDAKTGEVLMSFSIAGSPLNVAWSPDSRYLMISGDGINEPIIKRVWRSTDDLVAYAYECCVFRELTAQERVQFSLPERGE
jgi:WD40 repeat protein